MWVRLCVGDSLFYVDFIKGTNLICIVWNWNTCMKFIHLIVFFSFKIDDLTRYSLNSQDVSSHVYYQIHTKILSTVHLQQMKYLQYQVGLFHIQFIIRSIFHLKYIIIKYSLAPAPYFLIIIIDQCLAQSIISYIRYLNNPTLPNN